MAYNKELVVVRGGGDISTGTIQKIKRAGFKVVVLESEKPTSIRRHVCLSEAIYDGEATVEDIKAIKANNLSDIERILNEGNIAIAVDEKGEFINKLKPIAVIDAILAKKNLGTNRNMAPITIGLGPGFEAGKDVDVVVETMRGHNLARLIFEGKPMDNTGVPGEIKGVSKDRVIYSENEGIIKNISKISDSVKKGEVIAKIGEKEVKATIDGVLRGLIRDGFYVKEGLKIADIDPRASEKNNCFTISDKARNVGGASLEALLIMLNRKNPYQYDNKNN
ncbi:selenium-dependent molybdenum cofactor biosynthesis protein YqeB [Clostridium massiliamazoniense]|uniref:selenium-dependent molybdenum cofactor biosynthesis protein YqeB n=1 Tax=Clostridium massiliamazoniense TaxID=1347366 RepID=UPI0006D82FDE|nr:selenium-dependent molybdenum cofactor biosynthesis protein YqeB [Clostridium massiliamazoniense]